MWVLVYNALFDDNVDTYLALRLRAPPSYIFVSSDHI